MVIKVMVKTMIGCCANIHDDENHAAAAGDDDDDDDYDDKGGIEDDVSFLTFVYLSFHPLIHSSTLYKNTATHTLWADGPFMPQVQQLGPQVV